MSLDNPLKVLIAEDGDADRLLLRAIIKGQGHEIFLAKDGVEAIDLFKACTPDIVLLDALMPRLDGFETARFIKANMGEAFIPIIFLTSFSEADSLAKCLEAGGDDFLTKPYHSLILGAKINAFRRMMDMHNTVLEQKYVIKEHNQRLIQEQEVAKRTFDKIAHEGVLDAPNIQYSLSPMAVFNGDVLLAALRPNGGLCILLGDFTGHGLAAAIGAMPLSQAFYSMVAKGFSIRHIVVELNKKLKDILPIGVFCCAVVISMDFLNESIEVWNGGMPDTCLYHAAEDEVNSFPSEHLALGILSADKFNDSTMMLKMQQGDKFYMWSDGIIEAENSNDEMFGHESIIAVFDRYSRKSNFFKQILTAVNDFVGELEFSDDLSIVEIEMVDKHQFDNYQPKLVAPPLALLGLDWAFSYEIRRSSLRNSDPLPVLQHIMDEAPSFRDRAGAIYTVLTELYSNALEHGVMQLQSSMKKTPEGFSEYYKLREQKLNNLVDGFVRFDVDYQGDGSSDRLSITVTDSGDGFDYQASQNKPAMNNIGFEGRGLYIIEGLCDRLCFSGSGNIVEAEFVSKT